MITNAKKASEKALKQQTQKQEDQTKQGKGRGRGQRSQAHLALEMHRGLHDRLDDWRTSADPRCHGLTRYHATRRQ